MMNLENFLNMTPRQTANSLRARSDESKQKAVETLKKRWSDPAFREGIAQQHRQYWANRVSPMKGKKGHANKTSRAVVTPLGQFGSGLEAARAHQVSGMCIRYRIINGWEGYGYLNDAKDGNDSINSEVDYHELTQGNSKIMQLKNVKRRRIIEIQTPLGRFDSIKSAAKALGYSSSYTLFNRFKADPDNYYRIYTA